MENFITVKHVNYIDHRKKKKLIGNLNQDSLSTNESSLVTSKIGDIY